MFYNGRYNASAPDVTIKGINIMFHRFFKTGAVLSCIILLVACSSIPQSEIEYKKSRSLPALEIPPDLITPANDEAAQIPTLSRPAPDASPTKTTPEPEIRVERDGGLRWLVVKGDMPQLQQRIRGFWQSQGFEVQEQDTRLYIMDTSWEENRGITKKDGISTFFRKAFDVLYSASTRDQFRVRLEPGTLPGTTEIYLTHRGLEQVINKETPLWQPRPTDTALEVEMLKRLALYLGTSEDNAKAIKDDLTRAAPTRASITQDAQGLSLLVVTEDYANTWRRTGIALDHLGAKIEDQNRTLDAKRGSYQFRLRDPSQANAQPKGWFSKLFSGDKDKTQYFELRLLDQGKETHITVFDQAGTRDNSSAAQRLLTFLHEQLK